MRKIGGLIAVVLMALLVIVGCDNSTANNNNSTDKWEDLIVIVIASQPDYSWYDPSESEFVLTTANQFLGFADMVSQNVTFEGKVIKLAKGTYDFSQVEPSSMNGDRSYIGSSSNRKEPSTFVAFKGQFDGQGSVIQGVDLSYLAGTDATSDAEEDASAVGFFGVVQGKSNTERASVKNLVFKDCTLVSTSNTAGIAVGYAEYADIENITVEDCMIIGAQGVGGVVGRLYKGGKINGCDVINTDVQVVDRPDFSGSTENYNAGGVVGVASGEVSGSSITISDNTAENITVSASGKYAGGIAGYAKVVGVTFSRNDVTIASKTSISAGDGTVGAIYGYCGRASTISLATGNNTITIGDAPEITIDDITNTNTGVLKTN